MSGRLVQKVADDIVAQMMDNVRRNPTPGLLPNTLEGVLIDVEGRPVGDPFSLRLTPAIAGSVQNVESIQVTADRPATLVAVSVTLRGEHLMTMDLNGIHQHVFPGDTVSFTPGAMTISLTGDTDSLMYVIDEEPCLDD